MKVQQEVCEVKEVKKVGSNSGKGLLRELEENMKEVERKALDTVTIHPIPLLSTTLTHQEVMYRVHSPLVAICLNSGGVLCAPSASEKLGPGIQSSSPVGAHGSGKYS